jgi:tRNA-splicing ligase RtcB (3'-phosphate/5'-hydroxy nucleic acid ligase)
MKPNDLIQLGVPQGAAIQSGMDFIAKFMAQGGDSARLEEELGAIIAKPEAFLGDPLREGLARDLYAPAYKQRDALAPWAQWGSGLDAAAVQQMANACALPVAVAGALMPDAHVGYGLPIGGVLATEGCVIPYAVGVDIACRMRLSVYDRKASTIAGQKDRLANILESETNFGMGGAFKDKRMHEVMDEDWAVSPVTRHFKDKAWGMRSSPPR